MVCKVRVSAAPPGSGGTSHCPTGYEPETARIIYDLLRAGSSKLAYSVASGFPLVEYAYTLEADFDTASTTSVPNVGQDQKVVQDSIIDDVVFQVQNQDTPAGLDSITNFFFEQESGIEATMQIVGAAGGYQPYNFFTPIKLMCGPKKMWLITYNNGIVMNFQRVGGAALSRDGDLRLPVPHATGASSSR